MAAVDAKKRWSVLALSSCLLGLSSLGLLFFTGVPAVVLGLRGLRAVNSSDGRLRGRAAAVIGMLAGCLGTVAGVIGVIALVLVSLRGAAQRAQCQDNLRRIGSTLWLYQDEQRSFPAGTLPEPTLPFERRLSWYVSILNKLEIEPGHPTHPRQKQWDRLAESFDRHAAWDAAANEQAAHTPVRYFVCPSRPDGQDAFAASYIGMAGLGIKAAELPADSPRAGLFGYERSTTPDDITRGLSETMMLAETAWQVGPWAAGGPPTVRGLEEGNLPYIGPDRPWGGLHRDGLNILFADGAVHFLNADIEPAVFGALTLIHASAE